MRLKKSLGQHFLHDENVCRQVVEAVTRVPGMRLLEVGPGGGALTKYFADWEQVDYKAYEIDEEKVRFPGKNTAAAKRQDRAARYSYRSPTLAGTLQCVWQLSL